jgi:hypothetical protein
MNAQLGPLEQDGRIPADQQTRISSFLVSAHTAQARQLAMSMPLHIRQAWQLELHSQYCRELEIISLLARSTTWVPDPQLFFLVWQWEMAWLPRPVHAAGDHHEAIMVDMAALGHAIHAGIRPAALLPESVDPTDPFVVAMRRIEFESGRLIQAQILFLKGPQLLAVRDDVAAAVERRHAQVRELWTAMLKGLNVGIE